MKIVVFLDIKTVLTSQETYYFSATGFSRWLWRMPSSGMWHRVDLIRTDVWEERIAFIIRVTWIRELGTLAVTSDRSTLRTSVASLTRRFLSHWRWRRYLPSETSVLTKATLRYIPEDGILREGVWEHSGESIRLKEDEVTGGWRKLRNEELHNLYSSPYMCVCVKLNRITWEGNVAQMREKRNTYRLLLG
jgi:hypothetical protein